jgi:hypothetical protein
MEFERRVLRVCVVIYCGSLGSLFLIFSFFLWNPFLATEEFVLFSSAISTLSLIRAD